MAEDQPKLPDPEGEKQESSPPGSPVAADATESPLSEPGMETESQPNQTLHENVEVHHHAHHDHGKKSWKSYFWEFLMLFLAVFCEFLAECQREHKLEKERGRQSTCMGPCLIIIPAQ
ncbi:MAG TPA: hypothetical protein VLL95_13285 [Phnomibacter sp.]|nr:hypothetical protein [Phnomibacter sp.]